MGYGVQPQGLAWVTVHVIGAIIYAHNIIYVYIINIYAYIVAIYILYGYIVIIYAYIPKNSFKVLTCILTRI